MWDRLAYNKEHRISISFLSSFHSQEEKQGQDCKMDWIPHGELVKKSSCLMRRFRMGIDICTYNIPKLLLFMEEILHQLISSLSHSFTRFYTSQLVRDFFNQYWMDDQPPVRIIRDHPRGLMDFFALYMSLAFWKSIHHFYQPTAIVQKPGDLSSQKWQLSVVNN